MAENRTEKRREVFRLRYEEQWTLPRIYDQYPDVPQSTIRYWINNERKAREAAGEEITPPPRFNAAVPSAKSKEPIPPQHKVEFTESGDEATAFSISPRIKTLEQLLEAADVDLNKWQVNSWTANKWEMAANVDGEIVITPLFQVKANLGPNKAVQARLLLDDLRADLRAAAPVYDVPAVKLPAGGHLLEISVFDLHFGKWAWRPEAGDGYDMETAEQLFLWAVDYLAARADKAVDGISQVLLPLGNDLFNADGLAGMTTKGTPQDRHGSHRQHFRRVRQMVRTAVDRLVKIAPVKIVIVPGNHDMETMYYLGEALDDWYSRHEWVEVDNSPMLRKYHQHGRNLIGFTHGNEEKVADLPMIMSNEAKAEWSETDWHEWHIGHTHKKKEMKFMPVDEIGGVRIRTIPSLSATDEWHYKRGYVNGIRAAEAYVWHLKHGLVVPLSTPLTLMSTAV